MADIIQIRRDTAALWTTHNPILASGEFGYESDTAKIKIGDGTTTWTSLGYYVIEGVTSTAEELNILDGVTSTTAELNILDGVTSTTAELNKLDGVTADTAELNILDGVTSTTAELNILDGVTSTTAELNTLDALSRGSILYGNASGATTVLTKGTDGQLLKSDGTDISWAGASAADLTVVARTSNTELGAANKGQFINITSGSFTQTFDDPSTLGNGYWCNIKNSGSGDIVLQPGTVGSELLTEGNVSSIAVGGELAQNNVFSHTGNWTASSGNVSISGGTATWTGTANLTQTGSSVILANRMYLASYVVSASSSGNIQIAAGGDVTQGGMSVGTHHRILVTDSTATIHFESSNFVGSISECSVKLITNWRAKHGSGQRDQWRYNDPSESESGLWWWTDSLPIYHFNSNPPGNWIGQSIDLTEGEAYRLSIDCSNDNNDARKWQPVLGHDGQATTNDQYLPARLSTSTAATEVWDFTADSDYDILRMGASKDNSGSLSGRLDNWSLKHVAVSIDGAITKTLSTGKEVRIGTDGTKWYAGGYAIEGSDAKLLLHCDKNGNISNSKNVSSITDTATGKLTVTIEDDFTEQYYVVATAEVQATSFGRDCNIKENKEFGSFEVHTWSGDYQETYSDPDYYNIIAFGN